MSAKPARNDVPGTTVATARVGEGGRLVIPAAIRLQLGLRPGTSVSLTVQDGALVVTSRQEAIRRAQAALAPILAEENASSDAFIAARRAEAAGE